MYNNNKGSQLGKKERKKARKQVYAATNKNSASQIS